MKISQAFKMAFKSIWAKKTRSFLTMLGIFIGVASVMILVTVVDGSNKKMQAYYDSMGTNTISAYAWSWNSDRLSDALYNYCLSLDDLVDGVTPNAYMWGTLRYEALSSDSMQMNFEVYAGSDAWSVCNSFDLDYGRDLSMIDIENRSQVCVIGSKVKEMFFPYINPVGETITYNGTPFTVVGVYKQKDFVNTSEWWSGDSIVVMPYTLYPILMGSQLNGEYVIKAKNSDATNEAVARLAAYLRGVVGENGSFQVYSNNQYIDQSNEQSQMMSAVLFVISGISLLVAGIGIMNIMLVTVTERTREIGIRKAIGAERKSILVQFLIEAAIISAIGGLIGILLGYYGSIVFGTKIMEMLQLPGNWIGSTASYITPTPQITIGAFAFSVLLGVGFGTYPAIKASGLQPVVALRAE